MSPLVFVLVQNVLKEEPSLGPRDTRIPLNIGNSLTHKKGCYIFVFIKKPSYIYRSVTCCWVQTANIIANNLLAKNTQLKKRVWLFKRYDAFTLTVLLNSKGSIKLGHTFNYTLFNYCTVYCTVCVCSFKPEGNQNLALIAC